MKAKGSLYSIVECIVTPLLYPALEIKEIINEYVCLSFTLEANNSRFTSLVLFWYYYLLFEFHIITWI